MPLLAADVIGDCGNCDNRFLAKEAVAVATVALEIILRDVKIYYFSKSNILNIKLDPPVVVEDRQHTVLAAHVVTTIRKLTNTQRWGQATVAKAEAKG